MNNAHLIIQKTSLKVAFKKFVLVYKEVAGPNILQFLLMKTKHIKTNSKKTLGNTRVY